MSSKNSSASQADDGAIPYQKALNTIHWIRQGLGVVAGVVCGGIPLGGFLPFALFVVVSFIVGVVYRSRVSDYIDDGPLATSESDDPLKDLTQSGLASSVGVFLVTWIVSYNLLNV